MGSKFGAIWAWMCTWHVNEGIYDDLREHIVLAGMAEAVYMEPLGSALLSVRR